MTNTISAREIERAWLSHDPLRAKIPAEIWRKVRAFKRALAPTADAIRDALADVKTTKKLVSDFVKKKNTGRARALSRLNQIFAGTEFVGPVGDCFEARWLEPRTHLIRDVRDPGEEQAHAFLDRSEA